jgi:hypothetical protein
MMEGRNVERPPGQGRLSRRDLSIVARQFIAWNRSQKCPSRRARSDRWDGGSIWSGAVNDIVAADHTVPYGTDLCLGRVRAPNAFGAGYDHTVPTGQISFSLSKYPTNAGLANRPAPRFTPSSFHGEKTITAF